MTSGLEGNQGAVAPLHAQQQALTDGRVAKLRALISESFRVRHNHRPIYVDVGGNLARVRSKQHQVIFGRRGSGKSCLLIHFLNEAKSRGDVQPLYILADEIKILAFPDVLIRLLIAILEPLPVRWRFFRWLIRRPADTTRYVAELRALLDLAEEADVVGRDGHENTESANVKLSAPTAATANASAAYKRYSEKITKFRARKLDVIERHLVDYKSALKAAAAVSIGKHICVVLDDFYLLAPATQPEVIDYLHRLLRDTDVYLKVATVRHRTTLLRNDPQTVGVEISQDVEAIDLDRTLDDIEATQSFLTEMLDSLGRQVGYEQVSAELFNPDALEALTLASGGVPRDFLAILDHAIAAGLTAGNTRWLTPKLVYKGAHRLAWQTKRSGMRNDVSSDAAGLERLLTDLISFCLKDERKTAFLVSQEEAQRMPGEFERIQQLMDFKLIHIVDPDTSAASGRGGRFYAYTLDFSFFMEPRLRNIDTVAFWKIDDQRRRVGLREAPIYPLSRATSALSDPSRPADPAGILDAQESASEQPGDVE